MAYFDPPNKIRFTVNKHSQLFFFLSRIFRVIRIWADEYGPRLPTIDKPGRNGINRDNSCTVVFD